MLPTHSQIFTLLQGTPNKQDILLLSLGETGSIVSISNTPLCYLIVLGCAEMLKGSWGSADRWRKVRPLGLAKDKFHIRHWKQELKSEHFVQEIAEL